MKELFKIELKVMDSSMLQLAHAVCEQNRKLNGANLKAHIIDIDEVQKHLKAYVEAWRELENMEGKYETQ